MAGSSLAPQRPHTTAADALSSLMDLPLAALRAEWQQRLRRSPPAIRSADVLARLLARHLQAGQSGDLDPLTQQALALQTQSRLRRVSEPSQMTKPIQDGDDSVRQGRSIAQPRPALRAGDILVRTWKGVEHRVLVLDAAFDHRGSRYRSLSEIARVITGSRWSGPRFFGLEPSKRFDAYTDPPRMQP